MSIDKTLRFTQSRGFFIIKSLYQNLYFVLIHNIYSAVERGRLWLPRRTVQSR